jgi:hypothetical protein
MNGKDPVCFFAVLWRLVFFRKGRGIMNASLNLRLNPFFVRESCTNYNNNYWYPDQNLLRLTTIISVLQSTLKS